MNRICTLEERTVAEDYFRKISGLINDCASLDSARELRDRFDSHEDTSRDRRFLRRRYKDNLNELDHKISQYEKQCLAEARELDEFCHISGISATTTQPEDLVEKLMSPERRSEYRHLATSYEQKGILPPLWMIEDAYRKIPIKSASQSA